VRYNGIVNFPQERTRITHPWVWWDGAFTAEEIDKIVAYCTARDIEEADTLGGKNEKVRISDIKFHHWNEELDWLFGRFNQVIEVINNRWYGFALNGYESVQFTQYRAEVAGKYDWHFDMCVGEDYLPAEMIEPRKLSFTLLLNDPGVDFKGGDFQFNLGNEQEARTAESKKGRIIAFPSFMIHRVTPVTEGIRRSLVIWVTGPKFA
jgi:PKHD-type hydroxylase